MKLPYKINFTLRYNKGVLIVKDTTFHELEMKGKTKITI